MKHPEAPAFTLIDPKQSPDITEEVFVETGAGGFRARAQFNEQGRIIAMNPCIKPAEGTSE